MRLMMMNQNPYKKDIELYVLTSGGIAALPYSVDQLQSCHLLTNPKIEKSAMKEEVSTTASDYHLLFQFKKDLFYVSLNKSGESDEP